jgi:hypothetical protein
MGSEDQFRHYFPLMRRVIILVAVLTAIPVILWTITVFVRGYFGPPRIAGPRPLATVSAGAPAANPDASPAPQQTKLVDAQPVVEARATVTDARTMPPAVKWPAPGDRQGGSDAAPPPGAPGAAAMAPAAAGTDQRASPAGQMMAARTMAVAPAMPAGDAMPGASAATTGTLSAQDPPDQDQQTADTASPGAEPIAGPVPLPRHRPRSFAMLQGGVPMPRPRPEAAGSAGSEANPNPIGWLQKLFTPQQQ